METRNEAGATEQAAAGPAARHALRDLRVSHISLVEAAANGRAFLAKAAADGKAVIERTVGVRKSDPARRMVYGIVYAPGEADTDADTMSAAEIEKAAYGFMRSRAGRIDADHDFGAERGYVAESWLVRRGDALFAGEPAGAWAVGIKVEDNETWERVGKGELKGLSLAGIGERVPLEEALEKATAVAESEKAPVREAREATEGRVARVVAALKASMRRATDLDDSDSGAAEDPPLRALIEATVREVLTEQSFLKAVAASVASSAAPPVALQAAEPVEKGAAFGEADAGGSEAAEGEGREALAARVAVLEKALARYATETNGRQTILGGADAGVRKARRGLTFVQA